MPPRTSWVISPNGDVAFVAPDRWRFEPGDWAGVEDVLGTRLPRDYKELVGDGLGCVFGDELFIASPFDPDPLHNLIQVAAQAAWILASLRQADPHEFASVIHPEPGGLLGWGSDGGGGLYFWATDAADPDEWVVAIGGRPVSDPPVQRTTLTISRYLAGLGDGSVESLSLGGWPPPDARVVRRT